MNSIYQLHIQLDRSEPSVWRRIQVPEEVFFCDLATAINLTMGWSDELDYVFQVHGTMIYDFGPEVDMEENSNYKDSNEFSLNDYVNLVKTQFTYIYDLDNGWYHTITLEEIVPNKEGKKHHYACIDGKGACPPEDCEGMEDYQDLLKAWNDKNHPEHEDALIRLGDNWSSGYFNLKKAHANLVHYGREWERIYRDIEKGMPENEEEDDDLMGYIPEDEENEYEELKDINDPQDLLNDELTKYDIEGWIEDIIREKESIEGQTYRRLISEGIEDEKAKSLIRDTLAIEWYYDLKHEIFHQDERYWENLQYLPDKPREIPNTQVAVDMVELCSKGIPFTAIEYLRNDQSDETHEAVINGMKNITNDERSNRWERGSDTAIFYAIAAEGHTCEDLIDPVIAIYTNDYSNYSSLLYEQGEYLITQLSEQYPDMVADKIIEVAHWSANQEEYYPVHFLYEALYFTDVQKYESKLLKVLEDPHVEGLDSWAQMLAFRQVKSTQPIIEDYVNRLRTNDNGGMGMKTELDEALKELQTGQPLYPDIMIPAKNRRHNWKAHYAQLESLFYEEPSASDDGFYLPEMDQLNNDNSDTREFPFTPGTPYVKKEKPGRNDPCHCGSGKKYKKCCLKKDEEQETGL